MNTKSFIGKEFQGLVFDGSFETAVEIVQAVKAKLNGERIKNFHIVEQAGQTHLEFKVVASQKQAGVTTVGEVLLFKGDCLVVFANDYDVIKANIFNKFFKEQVAG